MAGVLAADERRNLKLPEIFLTMVELTRCTWLATIGAAVGGGLTMGLAPAVAGLIYSGSAADRTSNALTTEVSTPRDESLHLLRQEPACDPSRIAAAMESMGNAAGCPKIVT